MEGSEEGSINFEEPSEERSLAICVKSRKIWVSREVLACASPIFKKMLYGDFRESQENWIQLPGKSFDEILELVGILIPHPAINKVTDSNIDILLEFSDEYQIFEVRNRCLEFLETKVSLLEHPTTPPGNSEDNVSLSKDVFATQEQLLIDLLIISAKHNLTEILLRILPLASRKSVAWLRETNLAQKLPSHVLATIYEAKLRKWEHFLPQYPSEKDKQVVEEEVRDSAYMGPYAFVPLGRGHCQCCDNRTHVRSCKRCSASVCVSCSACSCPRCHYPHPTDPTLPIGSSRDQSSAKRICDTCFQEFKVGRLQDEIDSCACDYVINSDLLEKRS